MIIHDTVIRQLIQNKPIDASCYAAYPRLPQKKTADPKRKDVVMELHSRILPIIQEHSLYNHDLCRKLENDYDKILNGIHLHMMVNAPSGYDIYTTVAEGVHHIYIDLIQIADYTPVITEMMYILMHNLSRQCMTICMQKRFKEEPDSFQDQLNYDTFIEGFSLLLAWNENIKTYPFADASYEQRRETSFGYLYACMKEEDPVRQREILTYLKQASFWDKFTRIAGMFYLFDIYEQGIDKLKAMYDKGYMDFTASIFQ